MSRTTDRLARASARVSSRLQCEEFEIGGISYRGIIAPSQVAALMQAAGEIAVDDYTLTAHLEQFGSYRPARDTEIKWGGKLWTVKRDNEPENKTHLVLTIMRKGMHR